MSNELRNFLALSYDELEQFNLNAKEQRRNRVALETIREERIKYLTDEKTELASVSGITRKKSPRAVVRSRPRIPISPPTGMPFDPPVTSGLFWMMRMTASASAKVRRMK